MRRVPRIIIMVVLAGALLTVAHSARAQKDRWQQLNSQAAKLQEQGKYAEAQPLILAGYEGFKSREATILPQGKRRVPEAAERVVKLYQAWGKPEKAAEWREKVKAQAAAVPKPR